MKISVVVATYNNSQALEGFYAGLKDALNNAGYAHEIIFIDDNSEDSTLQRLLGIRERDASVKVIKWHHRAGQHLAMMSGMRISEGQLVITMDDDFRTETGYIPELIGKIREGHDIVLGIRQGRKDPFLKRRLPAYLLNLAVSFFLGRRIHDIGYNFNAFTADSLKALKKYATIIDSLREFRKFSIAEIAVDISGEPPAYNSRYALRDMVSLGGKILRASLRPGFLQHERSILEEYEVLG